jgi:hypothetical protein
MSPGLSANAKSSRGVEPLGLLCDQVAAAVAAAKPGRTHA